MSKTTKILIGILVIVIVIIGGLWILRNIFTTKPVSICGPSGRGYWIDISNCNKSCQTDEDCKFTCGCGAINTKEECHTQGITYDCADKEVKCENNICVAGKEKPEDQTIDWETYQSSQMGFSIKYPPEAETAWEDTYIGKYAGIKDLYSTHILLPTDQFLPSDKFWPPEIIIQSWTEFTEEFASFQDYIDHVKEGFYGKEIKEETITIDNVPAKKISYLTSIKDYNGRVMHVYVQYEKRMYHILGKTTFENENAYLSIFRQILSTFRFTELEELTLEELFNAEYYTAVYKETVKLKGGSYFKSWLPDSATGLRVEIFEDKIAFGDLNDDGEEDAAVIVYSSGGGSGRWRELAIMINEDGKAFYLTSQDLGDRVMVNSIDIESGIIILDMTAHGPLDPMCCPTVKTVSKYHLIENQLVEIPPEEAIQKSEVEQVHLTNLKYFLEGDAMSYKRAFSENYIDWGSGPMKITLEKIEELFEKEELKRLQGKSPEEVVDLEEKTVLSYSEIFKSEAYEEYEDRYGFHFQEGDVLIFFPPKKGGASLPDGYLGIYRKENGVWKIAMSD